MMLLSSYWLMGQDPVFKDGHFTAEDIIVPGLANATGTLNLPAYPSDQVDRAALSVKMDLGEIYGYGDLDFSATAVVTVFGEAADGTLDNLCSSACNFELTSDEPEKLYLFDFITQLSKPTPDYVKFRIEVQAPVFTISAPLLQTQKDQIIAEMTGKLRVVASYDIVYRIAASGVSASNLTARLAGKSATLSWSSDPFMPNYQVQLMYLHNRVDPDNDNYAWATWASNLNGIADANDLRNQVRAEKTVLAEIDWSKALSLETESSTTTQRITLAEGTGYYAWRVRPIGTEYPGGIANAKNWGEWSVGNIAGGLGENLAAVDILNGNNRPLDANYRPLDVFYFTDPDDQTNNIYSRTFTEGNRTSESITYANDLNQVKQTQTYLPSQKTTIVTQQVYDYSGRPVMATLPAPLKNQGLKGYYEGLVKTQGTDPADRELYRPKHFDANSNYLTPTAIDQSSNNPFYYYTGRDQIPDAEGFAFTRTLFYQDGKVKEESGVGKTHMIGGGGKTVKTFYATAAETELIRLFGDEAPEKNTVLKTINIDQNGTASIGYTSKEGNLIATCLAYQEQDNMGALEEPGLLTTEKLVIESNFKSYNKTVAGKLIHLLNPSPITFKYSASCTDLSGCQFTLRVIIHRLEDPTGSNPTWASNLGSNPDWSQLNDQIVVSVDKPVTCGQDVLLQDLELAPGSYLIEKQLSPVGFSLQSVPQAVKNQQNAVAAGIEPLTRLLTGWMDEVQCNSEIQPFFDKVTALENDLNDARSGNVTYASLDNKYRTGLGIGTTTRFFNGDHMVRLLPPYDIEINNPACGRTRIPINLTTVFDFNDMTYGLEDKTNDSRYMVNPFVQYLDRKTEFYPDYEGFAYSFFWEVIPEDISDLPNIINQAVIKGGDQILSEADFENAHIYLGGDLNPAELQLLGGYTKAEVKNRVKYIYYKFLAPYMKGWHEPGTFSLMTKHMLTDVYSASGTDKDGNVVSELLEAKQDGCGNTYQLATHASDPLATAQYYAEDLLVCWQSELSKLKVQVDPDGAVPITYNGRAGGVSSEVDDRTGNPGVHDGTFDDALPNIPVIKWFLKWILKSKLSKKMRDQQAGASGGGNNQNQIDIQYEQHLVEEFLQCTGLKIAKIMDDQDFAGGSHLPLSDDVMTTKPAEQTSSADMDIYYRRMLQDPNDAGAQPVQGRAKIYDGTDRGYYPQRGWDISAGSISKFEYMLDPVYAFKYFQYIMDSKKTVEVLTCYKDFNGCNFCGLGEVACDITSEDWTAAQRDTYLQMIRKFRSAEVTGNYVPVLAKEDFAAPTYMEPDGTIRKWIDDEIVADFDALKNNEFKDASGNRLPTMVEIQLDEMNKEVVNFCDSSRTYVYEMLQDSLELKCYKIVDCKSNESATDEIEIADLETLTDIMIEECKRRAMVSSYHLKDVSCKFINDTDVTYTIPVVEYGVGDEDDSGASNAILHYRDGPQLDSEIKQDAATVLQTTNYLNERLDVKDYTNEPISYFQWMRYLEVTSMGMILDVPTVCDGQNLPSTIDDNPLGIAGIDTDTLNHSMPDPLKPRGEHLSPLEKRKVTIAIDPVSGKEIIQIYEIDPTDGTETLIREYFK